MKRRQRSSLLFGGVVLECHTSYLAAMMIWRKNFGRPSIWEGSGLVQCELEDHSFFLNFHFAKCLVLWASITSNHPGGKSLVRHRIESILFPNSSADLYLLFWLIHICLRLYNSSRGCGVKGHRVHCTEKFRGQRRKMISQRTRSEQSIE